MSDAHPMFASSHGRATSPCATGMQITDQLESSIPYTDRIRYLPQHVRCSPAFLLVLSLRIFVDNVTLGGGSPAWGVVGAHIRVPAHDLQSHRIVRATPGYEDVPFYGLALHVHVCRG
jgi:hypothetical protein